MLQKKQDIKTREDLYLLVSSFYTKVRANETLAPFFASIKDWDEHVERLTNFWQSSLFLKTKYYGNPLEAHVKVDRAHGHQITEYHFGVWLNLWVQTLDELFEGEVTQNAKHRARKMGSFLYLQIFQARES